MVAMLGGGFDIDGAAATIIAGRGRGGGRRARAAAPPSTGDPLSRDNAATCVEAATCVPATRGDVRPGGRRRGLEEERMGDQEQPGHVARLTASAAWPVLVAAAAMVVLLGLHEMQSVVGQALLAYFITLAVSPLLGWFKRRRAPDWLGVLLAMFIVVAIIAAILIVSAVSLSSIQSELPAIEKKFAEQQEALADALTRFNIDLGSVSDLFSPSAVTKIIGSVAGWLANGLSFSFLLLFIVLYMLLDSSEIGPQLQRHLSPAAYGRLCRYQGAIRRYWLITTFTGFIAAALDFTLLMVLGIPFALFLAVLAFVTNYIPNVGYFIALIPAVFFAWIERGWTGVVVVFVGYWLFNTLAGNVIAPRLNATQLNISYTTSLIAVLFWGWVLGPVGGLISVPLTLFVRDLVLADRPGTRWMSDLISRQSPDEAGPATVAEGGGGAGPPGAGPPGAADPDADELPAAAAAERPEPTA
jgi:AI-2 transport protein TqsA